MRIRDWRNKMINESPKFRKAWYNLQWDTELVTSSLLTKLWLESRITQTEWAGKMGTKQSAISRNLRYGCELDFLQRAAKAVGKVIKLHIENERPLNPMIDYSSNSQTFTFDTIFIPTLSD